jgi:hypothetical protein
VGLDYVGQAVEVTRLDHSFVWLEHGGQVIGERIASVRGDTIHLPGQLRDEFPSDGLIVKELLPSRAPAIQKLADFPVELIVVRIKAGESNAPFRGSEFVRIQRGGDYFARHVVRPHASRDLVIAPALDAARGPYVGLELVTMQPTGISALNQVAVDGPGGVRSRVGLGDIRAQAAAPASPLHRLDGLELGRCRRERRVVMELRLVRQPAPARRPTRHRREARGLARRPPSAQAARWRATPQATAAGEAGRFAANQPVRARTTAAPPRRRRSPRQPVTGRAHCAGRAAGPAHLRRRRGGRAARRVAVHLRGKRRRHR